jgi:hypothetical protein
MTTAARTVTDLRLSPAAVAMARQLALPDGKVVFTRHPLTNQPDAWSVGGGRQHQGLPYRQLLAYGMAEVAAHEPPFLTVNAFGPPTPHPWQVVLTERGRAWVVAGCPVDVAPPMMRPKRSRPTGRMMRRG